jgi:phosphate transport system substrate-binding protein
VSYRLAFAFALAASLVAGFAHGQAARDYVSIVGSSTVFPFSSVVAEHFGKRNPKFKTPKVESTGTGGGFKVFCGGVGAQFPDVANASRPIKASEVELCAKNGVTEIAEIKIGYDGILIAAKKGAPAYPLTRKAIFLGLAKQVPDPKNPTTYIANPYRTWNEVDPVLPKLAITVFGPAPNHGTRDAFAELALEPGCQAFPALKALKDTDEDRYKKICTQIREDGPWTDVSEDYALVMGKLASNPNALAVFTFSYLDQNREKLSAATVDGSQISVETIASGAYPLSRPLFFYVKKAHIGVIPGIKEFVAEFASDRAMGADGYLVDRGLIPLHGAEASTVRHDATSLPSIKH